MEAAVAVNVEAAVAVNVEAAVAVDVEAAVAVHVEAVVAVNVEAAVAVDVEVATAVDVEAVVNVAQDRGVRGRGYTTSHTLSGQYCAYRYRLLRGSPEGTTTGGRLSRVGARV